MKTFVLIVSKQFPAKHKRRGQFTFFVDQILSALDKSEYPDDNFIPRANKKIHTMRSNYELWKKRIELIQAGKALLSIRYWSGSPYNYKRDGSKQVEVIKLTKSSGIGIQKIELDPFGLNFKIDDREWDFENGHLLAQNDGLLVEDLKEWFKDYDLRPMALIHFTKFRY